MFFITAEDFAMMIVLIIAIIGFFSYMIARFMRWIGVGEHVVLPTVIGAGLAFLVMLIGLRADSYYAPYIAIGVGIVGSIVGNLLLTHVVVPAAEDKVIAPLDDKIGGALERATERSEGRLCEKIMQTPDREERVKLIARNVWSHNLSFTTNIGVEHGYNEILRRIEDPSFRSRYPEITIQPTIVPGQFVITLFIPRGSIGLCLLESSRSETKGATYISFGLNNNYDNSGLEFKVKEIAALGRQISAVLDDLRIIVLAVLHESNCLYEVELERFR